MYLAVFPIESITSIKELYVPSTDAEFTAEDALDDIESVSNGDYFVDYERGKVERLGATWYLRPRCVQVIYSGGYYDPAISAPTADSILPPTNLQQGILL